MKGMHIDKVINFPFPTPPDRGSLSEAEKVSHGLSNFVNLLATRVSGRSRQGTPHHTSGAIDGCVSSRSSLL